jgi:hypothetical protein
LNDTYLRSANIFWKLWQLSFTGSIRDNLITCGIGKPRVLRRFILSHGEKTSPSGGKERGKNTVRGERLFVLQVSLRAGASEDGYANRAFRGRIH